MPRLIAFAAEVEPEATMRHRGEFDEMPAWQMGAFTVRASADSVAAKLSLRD
jgi:hypothetical protein